MLTNPLCYKINLYATDLCVVNTLRNQILGRSELNSFSLHFAVAQNSDVAVLAHELLAHLFFLEKKNAYSSMRTHI